MAFDSTTRRNLLDEAFVCLREFAELTDQRDQAGPGHRLRYVDAIRTVGDRLRELTVAYREGLHVIPLSRCPITDESFSHSWDPYGLDGLWWNFHKPVRLLKEPRGGKYHALSGAVLLQPGEVAAAPFLVEPGPQKPFVLPRLMEFDSVTAVVSQIQLGAHTAYPIVYFSDPGLTHEDGANEWGSNRFLYEDDTGGMRTGEYFDAEDEHLYDLNPWLESRRLAWIAPDDAQMRVQWGRENCPYLRLESSSPQVTRIMDGKIW